MPPSSPIRTMSAKRRDSPTSRVSMPRFFGIPPREAAILDPQHRLFLECAWEALETCRPFARSFPARPSACSLVAACRVTSSPISLPDQRLVQSAGAFALCWPMIRISSPRASPTSSGLPDPPIPCRPLALPGSSRFTSRAKACSRASAAWRSRARSRLRVPQDAGYLHQPGMILSPDGHCRPFDADAQGTIGGSGVGVVVLRLLADAPSRWRSGSCGDQRNRRQQRRRRQGWLHGAQRLRTGGGDRRRACRRRRLTAAEIGYVEAHGTATPLGDPIELRALARVFSTAGGAEGG